MKLNFLNNKHILFFFISSSLSIFLFQNCQQSGEIALLPALSSEQSSNDVPDATCGNRINSNGVCKDFVCEHVIEINAQSLNDIPARNADGNCYAMKLGSAISKSPSNLTSARDNEVISRNHDDNNGSHHPYSMASFKGEIKLRGPRVVKLSGGLSETAQIKVDNFILTGVYRDGTDIIKYSDYYKARGTSDSSIPNGSGNISFKNEQIPLEVFASGGVSSIAPIDLSSTIQANTYYWLDVRALDCGGDREMSNIYILFQ